MSDITTIPDDELERIAASGAQPQQADLSQVSDAELERIANSDPASSMSDAELEQIASQKKPMGFAGAALRAGAREAAPMTASMIAAGNVGAALAPAGPLIAAGGAIIAGAATYGIAKYGQNKLLESVAPELKADLDREPTTTAEQAGSFVGGTLPMLASFRVNPVTAVKEIGQVGKLIRGGMEAAERVTAVKAAQNLAVKASMGAAQGIVNPLMMGETPTVSGVGESIGMMLLMGKPYKWAETAMNPRPALAAWYESSGRQITPLSAFELLAAEPGQTVERISDNHVVVRRDGKTIVYEFGPGIEPQNAAESRALIDQLRSEPQGNALVDVLIRKARGDKADATVPLTEPEVMAIGKELARATSLRGDARVVGSVTVGGRTIPSDVLVRLATGRATVGDLAHETVHALARAAGVELTPREEALARATGLAADHPILAKMREWLFKNARMFRHTYAEEALAKEFVAGQKQTLTDNAARPPVAPAEAAPPVAEPPPVAPVVAPVPPEGVSIPAVEAKPPAPVAAKSEAAPATAAKEPWQMTLAEYEQKYGKPRKGATSYKENTQHKNAVAVAVNQGKPVPPEVLADYPNLAKPSAPAPKPLPDALNAGELVKPPKGSGATFLRITDMDGKSMVVAVDTLKGAGPYKSAQWGIKGKAGFVPLSKEAQAFSAVLSDYGRGLLQEDAQMHGAMSGVLSYWRNKEPVVKTLAGAMNSERQAGVEVMGTLRNDVLRAVAARTGKPFNTKDPRPLAAVGDALSIYREAAQKRETIEGQIAALTAGLKTPGVNKKWAQRAIEAARYALKNMDLMNELNHPKYGEVMDAQFAREALSGVESVNVRKDYVHHAHEEGAESFSNYGKKRTHETLVDAILAGKTPKSINAFDLADSRIQNGNQRIANAKFLESLAGDVKDPASNLPIIVKGKSDDRAYLPGEWSGEKISVLKGYDHIMGQLDSRAFLEEGAGRLLRDMNMVGKSVTLMLDTFHLGRLAWWSSMINSAGFKYNQGPLPWFTKGHTLLSYSVPELNRLANEGQIPRRYVKDVVAQKANLDLLVKNGLEIGRICDSLERDLIHHIPVFGTFNKFLFEKFQRGAMANAALLEFQRIRSARPDATPDVAAREVAKVINTRFGQLGNQGVFASPAMQKFMRMIFLAPQWNEGLIRSELGAAKDWATNPLGLVSMAQGKGLYMGLLGRSVAMSIGAQFVINQILNISLRGHPTWQNEEDDIPGSKVSAIIPDALGGPGFILRPWAMAGEIGEKMWEGFSRSGGPKAFKKADISEMTGLVLDSGKDSMNDFLRSRLSVLARPVQTMWTGKDSMGRTLPKGDVVKQAAWDAVPAPISAGAFVNMGIQSFKHLAGMDQTGSRQAFVGQFEKQAMASFGVKTGNLPDPASRIYALAAEWNAAHGKENEYRSEYNDWAKLKVAAKAQNWDDVDKWLRAMREVYSDDKIAERLIHFADRPFTGGLATERAFVGEMDKKHQELYVQAVHEKSRLRDEIGHRLYALAKREPKPTTPAM